MKIGDYFVPQTELFVSLSTVYASEDLAGETSSSNSAHKGIKPKIMSVSFLVRYDDQENLTEFYRVAEATDKNGDLVVYDVSDRTANAANLRQVIFTERVETREATAFSAWRVSFRLKEYFSVPEKSEIRTSDANDPSSDSKQPGAPEQDETSQPLTGFERILKLANDALADPEESTA